MILQLGVDKGLQREEFKQVPTLQCLPINLKLSPIKLIFKIMKNMVNKEIKSKMANKLITIN